LAIAVRPRWHLGPELGLREQFPVFPRLEKNEVGASAIAGCQILFLDGKNFACLDLDVSDEADPPGNVLELGVAKSGRGAANPQALV
jgi:hypothetical protein